jgi:predicted anti-sigma-YlaC factor YlaD
VSRDCSRIREELIDFVEGELAPERSTEIDAHLKTCNECAAYVESLKRTFSLLADDAVPEPPPGYWAYLPRRVRQEAGRSRLRRRIFVLAPVAAVAVALVLVWQGMRAPVPEVTPLEMITAGLETGELIESVAANEVYDGMFLEAAAEEITSLDEYLSDTDDISELIGTLSDAEAEAFVAELNNLKKRDEGTSKVMTDSPGKEC